MRTTGRRTPTKNSDDASAPSCGSALLLEVLADRTYRRHFAAQVLALLGTGLVSVALGLLAYDLTGDNAAMVLGTVFTIKMVAYVGIAPVAGGFANRVNRRALLVALDLVRAGAVRCLPFVTEGW